MKPSDLGVYDRGFEFEASDFDRIFEWNGTGWQDLPGQTPRSVHEFLSAPGTGYHLCDGTTNVRISQSDGSTILVNLPNLIGSYLKYGSVYTGLPVAASAPSLTGALAAHTHTVTPTGVISGTTGAAGAHSHAYVPTGTITATLPDHEHKTDPTLVTGGAKTAGLDPWSVTGTSSGYADLATVPLSGSVSTAVNGLVTIHESCGNVPNGEPFTDVVLCNTTSADFIGSLADGTVGFGDSNHQHTITDLPFTDTSGDHLHQIGELLSGGVNGLPISITATFAGDSETTDGVLNHTHSNGTLAFAGDSNTTSSTSTGLGTLAVGANGEPLHMVLLPYIKL